MRLKKAVAVFGSLSVILVVFMIYSARDLTGLPNRQSSIDEDFQDNKWLHFEDRIKQLEDDLSKHHNAVHEIKEAMRNMFQPSSSTHSIRNNSLFPSGHLQNRFAVSEIMYDASCPIQVNFVPRTDIQMLELYKSLLFDNIDGGPWKQGWRIKVDEKDWNRHNKLMVFVIPHSHNDPGWIKTVDEYYTAQTKHILDNMLSKLPEDPRRKFIWAEISYFSMWWDELSEEDRDKVKRLLRNNQLEIVTGGWVMNDEANSHWVSIMHQLTDGHQWLQQNLNYTPLSSWSIDPFGMSLTQPILLKEMGLQNMLIHRVHYSVKKQLASKQQLEFNWRQLWDGTGKTDMLTHMMPFYSYDIPHTCGPDPKVCCQFDFKRLPNHGLHCPWKVPPQAITDRNIAERAELLLDQYRKKSKLYKTNVLLVPLGDDFRYDHHTEWDVQYNNYQKLFDYMNSNLNLNVQAQFGTLSDYFTALHKHMDASDFPILSGDFFTYADRDDHYWSGYYTSRPFYKRLDRVLLSYLRAAETILTLAHLSGKPGFSWITEKDVGLEELLTSAGHALSLFQHHDGITGTAKDHVVIDYGKRMLSAISKCQMVLQICAHILLNGLGAEVPMKDIHYYNIDDVRHSHDGLSEHLQITIGVPDMRKKKVVLYNPLTFTRHEVVIFLVSTPFIEVTDFQGKKIKCQISPIFEYGTTISTTKFQLSFIANVPALSLVSYTVNACFQKETPSETVHAKIKIYNHYDAVPAPDGFVVEVSPRSNEFTLQNYKVTASFSNRGLLKALKIQKSTIPVHLDFAKYGVKYRDQSERSGAYLFLPDADAVPLQIEDVPINIIEGPIISSVTVQLPYVRHITSLYNTPGGDGLGVEIQNVVDIEKTTNFELIMRLSTNINSSDEFFTDVNGYQIMRRKRFKKLPLQANYYPIPTMAYIEDKETRLTIATSSPLGCSSLSPGQIEVMLDRRLSQDDNLGLGQGVLDNHPTRHIFRILLEKKTHSCQATADNHPAGFPTLSAHVSSQTLLNPLIRLLRIEEEDSISNGAYTPGHQDFGVDFSMPTLKSDIYIKGKYYIGFVIHRQLLDICFADRILLQQFPLSHGTVNITGLLPIPTTKRLNKSSLSFLMVENEVDGKGNLPLCPMEMQAFIL